MKFMPNSTRIAESRGASEPPKRVQKKFEEIQLRLECLPVAQQVWDKLLSDEERQSLGGNLEEALKRFRGTVGIWCQIHKKVWWIRAVILIARRIDLLSESDFRWLDRELTPFDPLMSERQRAAPRPTSSEDDPEDRIREAQSEFDVLLVEGNGHYRLYWHGSLVRQQWAGKTLIWEFLASLVKNAQRGQATAWDVLTGKSPGAVIDRRSRLKSLIPPALDALIKSEGRGQYRLELPPSQVQVIELEPDQWIEPDDDDESLSAFLPEASEHSGR